MATKERPADRGARRSDEACRSIGRDIRLARKDRNLSLALVGAAVGLDPSSVSRIERGLWPAVPLVHLFRLGEVVGLEIVLRSHPGGDALRDGAQVALLARFASLLPPSIRWGTEVPLPSPGDRRAWDGLLVGHGWRYGVEVDTGPADSQALVRRLALKRRDGEVDGILLIVPDTRRVRRFLELAAPVIRASFPCPGRLALERVRAGHDPGGSAVIRLIRPRPGGALRSTPVSDVRPP